jgi:hypothetical membrane protein
MPLPGSATTDARGLGRGGRLARALAWGGVIGPVAFVADWAILGLRRPGYSPVHDAISQLAALGAPTRTAMTVGFIIDGLGLASYGLALREANAGPAWKFATLTGLSTLGVAAFPLGTPTSGKLHGLFAVVTYASLVGVPVAWTVTEHRRHGSALSKLSIGTAIASATALAISLSNGRGHGIAQRTGLTIGDAWVVASALALVRAHRETNATVTSEG